MSTETKPAARPVYAHTVSGSRVTCSFVGYTSAALKPGQTVRCLSCGQKHTGV